MNGEELIPLCALTFFFIIVHLIFSLFFIKFTGNYYLLYLAELLL